MSVYFFVCLIECDVTSDVWSRQLHVRATWELELELQPSGCALTTAAAVLRILYLPSNSRQTPPDNNVVLHVPSMDDPSIQLQLDLERAVQHELARRRPLLHRLHASSWLLQIPRPANAVRHGSRFYYNILVDPCLPSPPDIPDGWFSRSSSLQSHQQTINALEDLLRDLEELASNIHAGSDRKSSVADRDDLSRLDTLVDAVAVTSTNKTCEEALREIHPDVPVFASQEAIESITGLQHFRSLELMSQFGEGGCRDWRSTTAVAGMPEWVGMSIFPRQDEESDSSPELLIAFNNHHYNRIANWADPKGSNGSRQKRYAAIVSDDEEDAAEAVLFTSRRIVQDDMVRTSRKDPPIHMLAVVQSSPTPGVDLSCRTGEGEARHETPATYCISERNAAAVEKGAGFLAWLIAKAKLTSNKQQKEVPRAFEPGHVGIEAKAGTSNWIALGTGESKVLI
jgi:hypothetical protein